MNTYENIIKEYEQAAKMCVHTIDGSQNLACRRLLATIGKAQGFTKTQQALEYAYAEYEAQVAAHKLGNSPSFGLYINNALSKIL